MKPLKDFTKEELDRLEWIMFHACPSNDPWADMMYLSGSGDGGEYDFPFDLDQVERIDITFEGGEAPQESIVS